MNLRNIYPFLLTVYINYLKPEIYKEKPSGKACDLKATKPLNFKC